MTICNAVLFGDRVLIAVDTACDYPEAVPAALRCGGSESVTKLFPLAGTNVLLAGRGQATLIPIVAMYAAFAATTGPMGFDELAEALPDIIPQATLATRQQMQLADVPPALVDGLAEKFEVTAAGWSVRAGCMAVAQFWNYADGRGLQRFDLSAAWPAAIAPRFDHEDWELNPPRDAGGMFRLAMAQLVEGRTKGLPPGTGGRLIVAELSRHSLKIADMGSLEG